MATTVKRSGFRPHPAHLAVGNQVFHNGVPVQLLYCVKHFSGGETWRVRPLFVRGPDREEQFTFSDRLSFMHTLRAPVAAAAAGLTPASRE